MRKPQSPYPNYTRSERIADGTMHALGVTGAFTGAIFLLIWTYGQVSGGQTIALAAVSGLQHMEATEGGETAADVKRRPLLLTAWDPAPPSPPSHGIPDSVALEYAANVCARLVALQQEGLAMALPGTLCSAQQAQAAAAVPARRRAALRLSDVAIFPDRSPAASVNPRALEVNVIQRNID